jgi:histidine ammonia-lyase
MSDISSQSDPVLLSGGPLSIDEVARVAQGGAFVQIDPAVQTVVKQARAIVDSIAEGSEPVYGINTGFGSLSKVRIDREGLHDLQKNIVRSHAACVGEPLPRSVVRGMMLILGASLARGHSGVRYQLIERLVEMLNLDLIPVIPSRGSVGASGDLAPLAHLALGLIGEGTLCDGSSIQPAEVVLAAKSIKPIELESKEGLALINGTHMMTAIGALAIADIDRILAAATSATAMAFDACRASHTPLDARLHTARNQPGQQRIAAELRELLSGSQIVQSHLEDDPRVQDPYALRASPQVLGAAVDAIDHVRHTIENELGGVSDNPLVFGDAIVSGGNFHGMPLAISLDLLRIALCHVAGIAERRVFWVLSGADTVNPVTPYLASDPGLHSGLMVAQYTAAALCNELGVLSHPASPGNISTSAGIEDYNSMGATAALLAMQSVDLLRNVIAIELLVMTQAFEHQRPLRSGPGVEAAYEVVRSQVKPFTADRTPAPDIAKVAALIGAGAIG